MDADARPVMSVRAAWLGAGLTIGLLDITDAFIFFGLRDVSPVRILQGIAAGLLGRDAFAGGWTTAVLGLVLHFLIAFTIAGVYLAAARAWARLRGPVPLWGPLYGILVYLVMNGIVLPLSAATARTPHGAVLVNGLLIHVFGVGIPAAWFAARALPAAPRRQGVLAR